MTHILSNFLDEYQTMVEIIEEELDYKYNPLTIDRIRDNLYVKFDLMNKQSVPRASREDEKSLYIKSQYKGTCTTYGKYMHKGK